MEIFEIWATLNLKGNALEKMKKFSEITLLASKRITTLTEKLSLLSKQLNSVGAHLVKINPELSKLSTTFVRLNTNTAETDQVFKKFNVSTALAANRTGTLIKNTRKLADNLSLVADKSLVASASLKEVRGVGMLGTGGALSGGGARSRSSGGMHMGLTGIPMGGLLRANAELAVPFAAYAIIKSAFKSGNEYERLQAQLHSLGYSQGQLGSVNDFIASNQIEGVSRIQMMHAYIAAQMATRERPDEAVGNNSEVKRFAPILAKAQFSANVMYGGMSDAEEMNLIRFAEIMGGSDMNKRVASLDAAAQIMVSSGGSIRPTELRTFARQAGGAFMNLDPEALVGLEPVLQETGGARMATGLVTGLRQLVTGTGSNFNKKQVEYLQSLGILKATFDSQGRPLGVHMKPEYERTLGKDPYLFLKDIVLPAFKKSGIDVNDPTQVSHGLTLAFGRTMSNILQIIWKNMQSIDRQRDQLNNIGGVNSQYQQSLKLGAAAPTLVSAAWSDFSLALSRATNPAVTRGLKLLAEGLEYLANFLFFFSSNPEMKKARLTMQDSNIKNMYQTGLMHAYDKSVVSGTSNLANANDYYGYHPGSYGSFSGNLLGTNQPGAVSSAGVNSGKQAQTHINLNIDSRTFAQAVLPAITKSMSGGGTIGGTSYTNVGLTPVSSNYTAVGSP